MRGLTPNASPQLNETDARENVHLRGAVLSVNGRTGAVTLVPEDIGAEGTLGSPSSDGFVLSSTAAGVRSWVSASLASLPSQTGNSGKFLGTNGTGAAWNSIAQSDVSGLSTALGAKAPLASPTFTGTVTIPSGAALGTPASLTLTNATGLPQSGVTSLVSDLAAKAPLASPTFTGTVTIPTGGILGTPTSLTLTNATGLPQSGVTNLTTDLAAKLAISSNLSDLASVSTARTNLGLVIGTNVQAFDAELSAIAGLTSAADRLPYFTGSATASLATFTSFGRSLIDDADAPTARTTLGLGTAAVLNTGTSGATIPLLSTANTWTLAQTMPVIDVGGAVYNVLGYAGATLGAKIQAAHDAMPSAGGTIDCRGVTGAQTISSTITLTKACKILFGNQTITASAGFAINSARTVVMEGLSTGTTITINGCDLISWSGNYSQNKNNLRIQSLNLVGGTGTPHIVYDASTYPSSLNFNESMFRFEGCRVSGFTADYPIRLGASFYYSFVHWNNFNSNTYSVYTDRFSDLSFSHNSGVSMGQLKTNGCNARITDNSWVAGGQVTADIWVDAGSNGADGMVFMSNNKHGAESDTYTRYKIVIKSTTNIAYSIPDIEMVNVKFYAAVDAFGQKAIDIESPVRALKIIGSTFDGFAYCVNDIQPTPSLKSDSGVWMGNTVTNMSTRSLAGSVSRVFVNNGRGFNYCDDDIHANAMPPKQTLRDAPYLSNRVPYSDTFSSWTANGVTVTGSQSDPLGGTTASLLTRAGSVTSENIHAAITIGAVGSAAAIATGSTVTKSIWLKAGNVSSAEIGLYDTTDGGFVYQAVVPLSTAWKRFSIPVGGLVSGHNYSVYIYPGSSSTPAAASTVSVWHSQVSDYDSDFLATSGSAVTAAVGTWLTRGLVAAGGIYDNEASPILAGSFNLRRLYDDGPIVSVDWENRLLKDDSGIVAVDWINRTLNGADGTGAIAFADPAGDGVYVNGHHFTADGTYDTDNVAWDAAGNVVSASFSALGSAGAGFLTIANQSAAPSTPSSAGRIYFDASNLAAWKGADGVVHKFINDTDTGTVTDKMLAGAVKPAVAVVSISNLTLSGEQTIDGQLTSGSLVLATAQSTGSQNGPWVSAAGAWARPTWYTNGSTTQAPQFLTTFVRLGTTYQGSTWRMTTASVTIGTTATTWVQTPTNLNSVTGTLSGSSVSGGTFGAVNGSALTALTAANITASTTVGRNLLNLTNPSAITWNRVNADNSVTSRSASETRTDLSLVIGTNVQAWDADLDTWAGVTPASGVATFLATPSSANLAAAVTNETGSGALVFATSPTLVTPALGIPSAVDLTNATNVPAYTYANAPVGVIFAAQATGVSLTAAANTLTTFFTVPGGKTFVATGGYVSITSITGSSSTTLPTAQFECSDTGNPQILNAFAPTSNILAVKRTAGLAPSTNGSLDAPAGTDVRFRINQASSCTTLVATVTIVGFYF